MKHCLATHHRICRQSQNATRSATRFATRQPYTARLAMPEPCATRFDGCGRILSPAAACPLARVQTASARLGVSLPTRPVAPLVRRNKRFASNHRSTIGFCRLWARTPPQPSTCTRSPRHPGTECVALTPGLDRTCHLNARAEGVPSQNRRRARPATQRTRAALTAPRSSKLRARQGRGMLLSGQSGCREAAGPPLLSGEEHPGARHFVR